MILVQSALMSAKDHIVEDGKAYCSKRVELDETSEHTTDIDSYEETKTHCKNCSRKYRRR